MQTFRTLAIDAIVMTLVGLVLAALGPFGSFKGDYATQVGYWLPAAFLGYVAFRPSYFGGIIAARGLRLPQLVGIASGVAIGAIPASVLILLWNGNALAELLGSGLWFQTYAQVSVIGASVAALFYLVDQNVAQHLPTTATKESEPSNESVRSAPFLDRLPAEIAQDLVALEMEDHYVRAHAPGRSTLILMRMRDAEAELAGIPGMRVHRSWWVAESAVESAVRKGRNLRLKLRGGLEAPVGRLRADAVREAGWSASRRRI